MNVLDTDTFSLLFADHPRVTEQYRRTTEAVVTTIITRIEILDGRFASIIKAEDGERLLTSQNRLFQSESNLATFVILILDARAAEEFDRLRQNKRVSPTSAVWTVLELFLA